MIITTAPFVAAEARMFSEKEVFLQVMLTVSF
jgi:hypothetical protein